MFVSYKKDGFQEIRLLQSALTETLTKLDDLEKTVHMSVGQCIDKITYARMEIEDLFTHLETVYKRLDQAYAVFEAAAVKRPLDSIKQAMTELKEERNKR